MCKRTLTYNRHYFSLILFYNLTDPVQHPGKSAEQRICTYFLKIIL